MATYFLSEKQRHQLERFPGKMDEQVLIQYFTLTDSDLTLIPVKSTPHSRLKFALSLCALRFLGFIPESLNTTPDLVIAFLSRQLNLAITLSSLSEHSTRAQTKSDHALLIEKHLGFKRFTDNCHHQLVIWLLSRAMEYDRPTLLLKTATEKLKHDKIVRPTLTTLERLVGTVREKAKKKIYQLLSSILSKSCKTSLDNVLLMDDSKGNTRLAWLKQRAISHSPDAILTTLKKITFLQQAGVASWDLSLLNPNRLKILNRLAKCSSNQALQRSSPERRYPALVAFMSQALEELIDEAVDLFDQCLTRSYSRSKNSLKQHHEHVRETTNEKIRLFSLMGRIILNEDIPDADLRNALYHQISSDTLRRAMDECDTLMRPENDKYLDYFAKRFSYLRQFTPDFIAQCDFQSQQENHPVLQAVDVLNETNKTAARKIPDNAPTSFISGAWKQYVFQSGKIDRKYYELCTLWALRNVLRSGDIWVDGGRRYNNPEHYLIPRSQWPDIKASACELLQLSSVASVRLQARQKELHQLFEQLNTQIPKDDKLRIENGALIITPLEAADESASLKHLRQLMTHHLPKIDLPELVVEVDEWIHFSECFYPEGNQSLNPKEFPVYFYGAFLAESTNLGTTAMSGITDLDYERLVWHNHCLIRDETLDASRVRLVNFMHNLALTQHFGDGRFSSSDGRRVPVAVKTTTAGYFVKYFAFETGLNIYSWTSDQYPQYGNTVTSPTMRESTFVLDAILDNETELQIERHTTDTGGYTEIIFALFDLLGLRFEPRIKNLGDQRLYDIAKKEVYANIDTIITGNANTKRIETEWDDMLRLAASLKKGYVSASLLISKLQALPQKSNLVKALQEYGKIVKTVFLLRYALSEDHRREISAQLNKGEAVHDLQQFLHLGREGKLYLHHQEEQVNHFGCLNVLLNIVMIWNTVYMAEVIDQLVHEGYPINEADLKHLSPARRGHINPYGKYHFNLDDRPKGKLRPLRNMNEWQKSLII